MEGWRKIRIAGLGFVRELAGRFLRRAAGRQAVRMRSRVSFYLMDGYLDYFGGTAMTFDFWDRVEFEFSSFRYDSRRLHIAIILTYWMVFYDRT